MFPIRINIEIWISRSIQMLKIKDLQMLLYKIELWVCNNFDYHFMLNQIIAQNYKTIEKEKHISKSSLNKQHCLNGRFKLN